MEFLSAQRWSLDLAFGAIENEGQEAGLVAILNPKQVINAKPQREHEADLYKRWNVVANAIQHKPSQQR